MWFFNATLELRIRPGYSSVCTSTFRSVAADQVGFERARPKKQISCCCLLEETELLLLAAAKLLKLS